MGDRVLVEVVKRLKKCLRQADTLARLGGDEFGIILHDLPSTEGAERVAKKLCACLASPLVINSQTIHMTISIGISFSPKDGDDPKVLVKNADAAMYQAKVNGKNTYYCYQ